MTKADVESRVPFEPDCCQTVLWVLVNTAVIRTKLMLEDIVHGLSIAMDIIQSIPDILNTVINHIQKMVLLELQQKQSIVEMIRMELSIISRHKQT